MQQDLQTEGQPAGPVNAEIETLDELSVRDAYRAVPVSNRSARRHEVPGGIVIEVPYRTPPGAWVFVRWLLNMRRDRRLFLDELGAALWALCDGERTVWDIIQEFARRYRLTFMESRTSVMAYLRTLMQRGALAVMLFEPETEGAA